MDHNYIDVIHDGLLEGLENYRVFRRRYPAKTSLPVRLITDWYIQEIPMAGRKFAKWICLVGVYKDALIRTSPVTSVLAPNKISTCNCIYMLGPSSKVLQNPFYGVEKHFVNGFPDGWEAIVDRAFASAAQAPIRDEMNVEHEIQDLLELDGADAIPVSFESKVASPLRERSEKSVVDDQKSVARMPTPQKAEIGHIIHNVAASHVIPSAEAPRLRKEEVRLPQSILSEAPHIPNLEARHSQPLQDLERLETPTKNSEAFDSPDEADGEMADDEDVNDENVSSAGDVIPTRPYWDEPTTKETQDVRSTKDEVNNEDVIKDIDSVFGATSGPIGSYLDNEFESCDESLLNETQKKRPRARRSVAKENNKFPTVEEFINKTSPFRLPKEGMLGRALQDHRNSSFETTKNITPQRPGAIRIGGAANVAQYREGGDGSGMNLRRVSSSESFSTETVEDPDPPTRRRSQAGRPRTGEDLTASVTESFNASIAESLNASAIESLTASIREESNASVRARSGSVIDDGIPASVPQAVTPRRYSTTSQANTSVEQETAERRDRSSHEMKKPSISTSGDISLITGSYETAPISGKKTSLSTSLQEKLTDVAIRGKADLTDEAVIKLDDSEPSEPHLRDHGDSKISEHHGDSKISEHHGDSKISEHHEDSKTSEPRGEDLDLSMLSKKLVEREKSTPSKGVDPKDASLCSQTHDEKFYDEYFDKIILTYSDRLTSSPYRPDTLVSSSKGLSSSTPSSNTPGKTYKPQKFWPTHLMNKSEEAKSATPTKTVSEFKPVTPIKTVDEMNKRVSDIRPETPMRGIVEEIKPTTPVKTFEEIKVAASSRVEMTFPTAIGVDDTRMVMPLKSVDGMKIISPIRSAESRMTGDSSHIRTAESVQHPAEVQPAPKRPSIRIPIKPARTSLDPPPVSIPFIPMPPPKRSQELFVDSLSSICDEGSESTTSEGLKTASLVDSPIVENAAEPLDQSISDTIVSEAADATRAKLPSLPQKKESIKLPMKIISSIESVVADQSASKSFSKPKKKKTILVMPKKLKNLTTRKK